MNNSTVIIRFLSLAVLVSAIVFFNCPLFAETQMSNLLEQAKTANDNLDYDEAFDLTIQVYKEDKENPMMWLQMGIALQGLDKYSDAISCFEKAIFYGGSRKDILSDAYMNLGALYMELKSTDKGLEAVNKGLGIDKDNWHLLALRAHLLYNNDKNQAKKDLAKAEKLAPKDPSLFLEEAFLYHQYEEYDKALDAAVRTIDLGGNTPVFYFAKGNIQEKMNNIKGATNSYLESILVGDFDYIFPFAALHNQDTKENRNIILDEIKNKRKEYPKLNGILFVLLDNWNEDEADEIYNELVRNNDKEANHYFRKANLIADRIRNNTARSVVGYDETDNTARGVVTQPSGDDDKIKQIAIVEADKVINEVMDIDSNDETYYSKKPNDEIFAAVEHPAEFPGGTYALMKWLSENIRYPKDAQDDDVQGRSMVRFVVEIDGSISNVEIAKRNDPALDAEAIRVVQNIPKWDPGKNGDQPVRSYFTLPINFRLNK